MEAYKRVAAARAKGRPSGNDFIQNILEGFLEFHGDRRFADDQALLPEWAGCMICQLPRLRLTVERIPRIKSNEILAPRIRKAIEKL